MESYTAYFSYETSGLAIDATLDIVTVDPKHWGPILDGMEKLGFRFIGWHKTEEPVERLNKSVY